MRRRKVRSKRNPTHKPDSFGLTLMITRLLPKEYGDGQSVRSLVRLKEFEVEPAEAGVSMALGERGSWMHISTRLRGRAKAVEK